MRARVSFPSQLHLVRVTVVSLFLNRSLPTDESDDWREASGDWQVWRRAAWTSSIYQTCDCKMFPNLVKYFLFAVWAMRLTIILTKTWVLQMTHKCPFLPSAPKEILRVVGAERESPGGGGAAQQTDQRGSVLRGLQQNADAVRAAGLDCGHAGQKSLALNDSSGETVQICCERLMAQFLDCKMH